MTTIACSLTQMSGDSFLTDDSTTLNVNKVFKFKGVIVGVCGTYQEAIHFVNWMKGDINHEKPEHKDFSAIILNSNGIFVYEGGDPYPVYDGFASIGSGSQAAMAALHLGFDTEQAVKTACVIDPCSGGRIKTLKL